MTCDAEDRVLQRLRHLQVLESAPDRQERVRARCRTALSEGHGLRDDSTTRPRVLGIESGFAYSLSAAYLLAIIGDVLRIYLRR
jgi:hypothetical protein